MNGCKNCVHASDASGAPLARWRQTKRCRRLRQRTSGEIEVLVRYHRRRSRCGRAQRDGHDYRGLSGLGWHKLHISCARSGRAVSSRVTAPLFGDDGEQTRPRSLRLRERSTATTGFIWPKRDYSNYAVQVRYMARIQHGQLNLQVAPDACRYAGHHGGQTCHHTGAKKTVSICYNTRVCAGVSNVTAD